MRAIIWNSVAVLAACAIAFAYEFGLLSAANAFFFAFSLLVAYLGSQLVVRDHMALGTALRSIFKGSGSRLAALAVVSGLSGLVVMQTLGAI